MPAINIDPHSIVLFQGDSITDTGRSRFSTSSNSPDALGFGYVRMAADHLLKDNQELQIFNRGNSGDRIRDLAFRWQRDSIQLKPDLVSILIGVNDTWNYLYMGMGSDPTDYQRVFKGILEETRSALPEVKFVLCEPFLLITGDVSSDWMDDITQRQHIVKQLADEFQAVYVPFQSALNEAAKTIPAHRLLDDGVHPTEQGHRLLAECWINSVLG